MMEYTFEISKALEERNIIERERLEFDKNVFEFNRQINIDNLNVNTDLVSIMNQYSNMIQNLNNNINTLAKNQDVLYKQIQEIKVSFDEFQKDANCNVEPVMHAKWIISKDDFDDGFGEREYPFCSNCHTGVYRHDAKNYCPNCGSKMDEEK